MNRLPQLQQAWHRAFSPLLTVFLESSCPLCDRTTASSICSSCRKQLSQSQLANPLHQASSDLPVLAWGAYQGSLRQAMAALKYNQKPDLAEFLGKNLGQVWQQQGQIQLGGSAIRPIVVPIPLHEDKLRQRGFNQAELLARWFCRTTHLPLMANGLVRVRATKAQHGLGAAARQENLSDAFDLGHAWQKTKPTQPVLLIDDIYTTGATVRSAADTLKRYGISVVGVGAIARAMPSAALEQS